MADPSKKRARRFRCKSWRHEGSCRTWRGSQDFARIRTGIASRSASGWVYVVLTFDRAKNEWAAYKGALGCWAKLRKRMSREWGKIEYAQTWEQHASGWPHVNILVHNEALAAACAGDGWKKILEEWLKPNAIASGFGFKCWVEPMRDKDAMAGYMTKLVNKLTAEVADAHVKDQVPVDAPAHFRRLRASRGLLPSAYSHGGEWTGELRQVPVEHVEAELEKEQHGADDRRAEILLRLGACEGVRGDSADDPELDSCADVPARPSGRTDGALEEVHVLDTC